MPPAPQGSKGLSEEEPLNHEKQRQGRAYPADTVRKLDSIQPTEASVTWNYPSQPGPSRVIVVVAEAHANEMVLQIGGRETYQAALKTHASIERIMTHLDADTIYKDGVTPSVASHYNKQIDNFLKLREPLDRISRQLNLGPIDNVSAARAEQLAAAAAIAKTRVLTRKGEWTCSLGIELQGTEIFIRLGIFIINSRHSSIILK